MNMGEPILEAEKIPADASANVWRGEDHQRADDARYGAADRFGGSNVPASIRE